MAVSDFALNFSIVLNWLIAKANGDDFADTEYKDALDETHALVFGTASDQGNQLWVDQRTVTQASPLDDIDLNGVLQSTVEAATINFTRIKGWMIVNLSSTNGAILTIGGKPGSPWQGKWGGSSPQGGTIRPGMIDSFSAPLDGYAVTAGSADSIRIQHPGTAVGDISYLIVVWGLG